jgi:hypothetical protein
VPLMILGIRLSTRLGDRECGESSFYLCSSVSSLDKPTEVA